MAGRRPVGTVPPMRRPPSPRGRARSAGRRAGASTTDPAAPARWLIKSDPETNPFDELLLDGSTLWDGVRNSLAQRHLRAFRAGDEMLFHHTGDQRSIVGVAAVIDDPAPDLTGADPSV